MPEVVSRPSATRGRGSGRGSRGGFAGRGGRRANGDRPDHKSADDSPAAFESEGDFGELRKQYGDKTSVIREMFPDWSEADVLFALQETNGDQNEAVARIAEGTVSQWGEVSKPKKTTRAKGKDAPSGPPNTEPSTATSARAARGGRSVSEGGRGRGRTSERGARGGRGRSALLGTNGVRNKENQQLSIPTEESFAWDSENKKADKLSSKAIAVEKPSVPDAAKPPPAQTKTWASMLRQSTAPKPPPVTKEAPANKSARTAESRPAIEQVQPDVSEAVPKLAGDTTPVARLAIPTRPTPLSDLEGSLPPAKDELTETNLEQVADDSKPPATGTAASTAADSWDPRQGLVSATTTPISAAQQQHQAQRVATSGYAASAIKATTERSARVPSYQRRVLDQEEAVRMPGNRELERAAVQFGAFNLNGGDEDIDGDREEAETRTQPPADSPVAHPRATLPPVPQSAAIPDSFSHKSSNNTAPADVTGTVPTGPAAHTQAAHASVPNAQQYGRFGHGGTQDATAASQKSVDSFSHQGTAASQAPFDNYSAQASQTQTQQPGAVFGAGPSDYSYYSASQQDRNHYNYYGQQYGGQQTGHGQHEGGLSQQQQRQFAGYSAQADSLSQYPQSGAIHGQPRFGGSSDSQNSGHSTPNPTAQAQQQQHAQQQVQQAHQQAQQQAQQQQAQQQQAQQQQAQQQAQQAQQAAQQQAQQQGAPGAQPQPHGQQYPGYSHPYYSNPYYHQYYSGYGQGGFGPYGKGGMYGQPYGVTPNAPYDHTSSPASFGPSSLHRESGLGASTLGDYGRGSAGQAAGNHQAGLGGSSLSGAHDNFARGASSFPSQGQQTFTSQGQAPAAGTSDELKHFGDGKAAGSGPSPALGGGPRPGSAANNAAGGQGGLPPPQASQMGGGYGGYPSHLQGHSLHASAGGYGMGAGAGASQHGSTPYGSYGQSFGSGGYYDGGGGGQQQRGGWGGNYH